MKFLQSLSAQVSVRTQGAILALGIVIYYIRCAYGAYESSY